MATNDTIVKLFEQAQENLVMQASDLSLDTLANMVEAESIDVMPEFQRRERWNRKNISALIESFLLNIPVPPIYLAEEQFGKYVAIDGKQRLSAIHNFMTGNFKLSGLKRLPELDGHALDDLPDELQNALRVRPYLRVITLLRQSEPKIKYEVFHRLNSGGEPLNPQEIRNVLYRGALNDAIMSASENDFLRDRLKIRDHNSQAYRSMLDVEYVLRFLTLRETWKCFSGDFRSAMDSFMANHSSDDKEAAESYVGRFTRAASACKSIWDFTAFRRHDGKQWRDQMLGGLYDAQMIAVDSLNDQTITRLKELSDVVQQQTVALFKDADFNNAVRVSTNTPSRVKARVQSVVYLLKRVATK